MLRTDASSDHARGLRPWSFLTIASLLFVSLFNPVSRAFASDEYDCTLSGTARADTVTIEEDGAVFCGLGGNDRINVLASNVVVYGGTGNDTITALAPNVQVYGGLGNDVIVVTSGTNTIDGGAGNDRITGGTGDDTITGGTGNDTINVAAGTNTIDGGVGNDRITGGTGDDTIFTGLGSDVVAGNLGSDRVISEGSKNRIDGGADDDFIVAGNGNDLVNGGTGADECYSGARSAAALGNLRNCGAVMAGESLYPMIHRNFISSFELWVHPGSSWNTGANPEFSYQWFDCENRIQPGATSIPVTAGCVERLGDTGPSLMPEEGVLPLFFAVLVTRTTSQGSQSKVASIGSGSDLSPPVLENVRLSAQELLTTRENWWSEDDLCDWSGRNGILPQAGKCGTWISEGWLGHYRPAQNSGRMLRITFDLDDLDSGVGEKDTSCSLFRVDVEEDGSSTFHPPYSGRTKATLINGNYRLGTWQCDIALGLLDDVGRWQISILTRDINGNGIYHMGLQPNWRAIRFDENGDSICDYVGEEWVCETQAVVETGWYTRVKQSDGRDYYQNLRTDVGPSWIEVMKR